MPEDHSGSPRASSEVDLMVAGFVEDSNFFFRYNHANVLLIYSIVGFLFFHMLRL